MAGTAPPKTRQGSVVGLHGDFRVDVLGTQESLDLDCGKFYTVGARFLPSSTLVSCLTTLSHATTQEYILRCTWIERNGTPEVHDDERICGLAT